LLRFRTIFNFIYPSKKKKKNLAVSYYLTLLLVSGKLFNSD